MCTSNKMSYTDKTSCRQNVLLDKTSCRQNVLQTKRPSDKTSCRQNVLQTKRPVGQNVQRNKMSNRHVVFKMEHNGTVHEKNNLQPNCNCICVCFLFQRTFFLGNRAVCFVCRFVRCECFISHGTF